MSETTFREKKPGMRACDVKNERSKLCLGHLKRWYRSEEKLKTLPKDAEIYRCERCHALYKPDAKDDSTAGQRFTLQKVNIFGGFHRS